MRHEAVDNLRKRLLEQIRTQVFADTELCKELISLSERENDNDGIAIGHIWLAEAYLFKEKKIDCSRELEIAKNYLDEKLPSEILENYYSIEYKLYTSLYDTQTAFDYCLKSLKVADQLYENPDFTDKDRTYFINTIENRFVKYYGNIGINFFNQGAYEKALLYCQKALGILEPLEEVNVHAECLLRLNIIISLIRTDTPADVMHHIRLLEMLPIEPEALKVFVDYAYVNYYLYLRDRAKAAFYVAALLGGKIEAYADRLTAVDFYIDILEPVMELEMAAEARLLFKALQSLVREDEIRPMLSLIKLKIIYEEAFGQRETAKAYYQEYYELYLKNSKQTNLLISSGLEVRLKLSEVELENSREKGRIHLLQDIANYDELTRLFNRRYLGLKFKELLNSGVEALSLAMIDIDYFKEYNDTYGHLGGDDILKRLSACLKDTLYERMIACRYGGDEFVVLSWNDAPNALCSFAEELAAALGAMGLLHETSQCSKQVTVSIGLGSETVHTQADLHNLFERADKALYAAKEKGRNQIVKR